MPSETKRDAVMEDFLSFVQDDASIASLLFSKREEGNKQDSRKEVLLRACQHLFRNIENLSTVLAKVHDPSTQVELSGLEELYLGPSDGDPVDAETLWGQVDLQNEALHRLLKKSIKKLAKSTEDESIDGAEKIRLLDINSELLNVEEDEQLDEQSSSSDRSAQEEDEENEEARRIRERMERAMKDQQDEDEEDQESYPGDSDDSEEYEDTRFFGKKKTARSLSPPIQENQKAEENLIDPAVEELNNGFFDINEMEAFADEEEDYLPEDAMYQDLSKSKKAKKAKSIHQRQRQGQQSDSDEETDEEEMEEQHTKRKKYREEDEIDALYKLYEEPVTDDDDADDTVNMTAADLFGGPDRKHFHKWKAQQSQEVKKTARKEDEGDDDSWDAYEFDDEETDWGGTKADRRDLTAGTESDGTARSKNEKDNSKKQRLEKGPDLSSNVSKQPEKRSKYARDSEKLKQETERLEQEMLSKQPWQMVGEATSTNRPVNSLLEGTPEFEVAAKQAPAITVEHTADLESVIKRRILNEEWDDVIPRELPDVAWNKKRGELPEVSQEKAKLGLGELYEREYLKKAVGYDVDAAEQQSEEDKAKNEMKQLFANVCSKLDALSNYHFAPRPIADEADVKPATTPAIAMEEVLPLHVSDARAVAPEEVYDKKRGRDGILRSETELDQVSITVAIRI